MDLINNKEADIDQRIRKMHEDRIAQALEKDRAHDVIVEKLTKEYGQLKKHSVETIDRLLTELEWTKGELKQKQNHILEVEAVHIQATKLISALNGDIAYLQGALDSARRWAKKPWFRRIFSRWKAPQRNAT